MNTDIKSYESVPARAGIGLRSTHYQEVLNTLPKVGWMEVHSENFFSLGGVPMHYLEQIRSHYPISLHGVGLSLGSTDLLSQKHLSKLKSLAERIQPNLISEHLSWSSVDGYFSNDLLPIPYTEQSLDYFCSRINQLQEFLGRQILVENISSYIEYKISTIPECEFIAEIAARTGCGILLDINNIYVSSYNLKFDPYQYLKNISPQTVMEIHLAGFERQKGYLIDTHSRHVHEDVWKLYEHAIQIFGNVQTLIEWDADIPELPVLLEEAHKANIIMESNHATIA